MNGVERWRRKDLLRMAPSMLWLPLVWRTKLIAQDEIWYTRKVDEGAREIPKKSQDRVFRIAALSAIEEPAPPKKPEPCGGGEWPSDSFSCGCHRGLSRGPHSHLQSPPPGPSREPVTKSPASGLFGPKTASRPGHSLGCPNGSICVCSMRRAMGRMSH
jgi:hypothetical protein